MSEVGSTKTQEENLLDLPHDILSNIESGLGLLEWMNLGGVCKYWRDVSSKALLKQVHESFECDPWFLFYEEEGSKFTLQTDDDRLCTANIPELEGATFLASHEGWLLVFRGGSMFFFCPFSMAKINLPSCPFTELSGHTAAFSAPPTSQDCIVVVIRRCSEDEVELHLLSRGNDVWTKHMFVQEFGMIRAAFFSQGLFQFLDNLKGLITFAASAETEKWNAYVKIKEPPQSAQESAQSSVTFDYWILNGMLGSIDLEELGFDTKRVSISVRGTRYSNYSGTQWNLIPDDSIEALAGSESTRLKGVWILPRYHTPSMDHKW